MDKQFWQIRQIDMIYSSIFLKAYFGFVCSTHSHAEIYEPLAAARARH